MNKEFILENETVICRSEKLLSNKLGEDVVMMDIEKGSYYGMEAVAARIWEQIETPVSLGAICATLISEFNVSEDKCHAEVRDFIADLLERDIVRVVTESQ